MYSLNKAVFQKNKINKKRRRWKDTREEWCGKNGGGNERGTNKLKVDEVKEIKEEKPKEYSKH